MFAIDVVIIFYDFSLVIKVLFTMKTSKNTLLNYFK